MGTANLLQAARGVPGVRAVVIITSDKCYDNREVIWAYRETDAMGGHDPYSASKGCAELVTAAMARSFFDPHRRAAPSPRPAPATSSAAATGPRTGWCPTSCADCWPASRS